MWNKGWDTVFTHNRWGRYPPEELVRFVARNFYHFNDRSEVKLLEIGCGPAANLWYIAREGFTAYGMDGSGVALEKAKQRLEEEGLRVHLQQADAMNLPYEDNFFDGVFDIECICANTKKDSFKIINEVHRVLKPSGKFFSKTFMTGTDGDGTGDRVDNEPHTYQNIPQSLFHEGYGALRFTAEEEIPELYGQFKSIEYDYLDRTDRNRKHHIKEWLITCSK